MQTRNLHDIISGGAIVAGGHHVRTQSRPAGLQAGNGATQEGAGGEALTYASRVSTHITRPTLFVAALNAGLRTR